MNVYLRAILLSIGFAFIVFIVDMKTGLDLMSWIFIGGHAAFQFVIAAILSRFRSIEDAWKR